MKITSLWREDAFVRAPAMWSKRARRYTRCRFHGGASTGPRTLEGLERCRKANWSLGEFSANEKARRRELKTRLQICHLERQWLERRLRFYLKLEKRAVKSSRPSQVAFIAQHPM
jgi:hypothetical protein